MQGLALPLRQHAEISSRGTGRHTQLWDRISPRFEGDLRDWEKPWLDLYIFLAVAGYIMRDRFNPNYQPSTTGISLRETPAVPWQNRVRLVHWQIMDAIRSIDALPVIIKAIDLSADVRHHEWNIARIFARTDIASDARNHCIPILDHLTHPGSNWELLVMPHMLPFHVTPFETVGEVVDFLRQILEGVAFMHMLNITHRDIGPFNIVMFSPDLFPNGTNYLRPGYDSDPFVTTARKSRFRPRREVFVRYYLIDFGLSWHFSDAAARHPLQIVRGQFKDAPEYASNDQCDGFALDVWSVGRVMQDSFFNRYRLPKFLTDFVGRLTATDPLARPTAAAALDALDAQIALMDHRVMERTLSGLWPKVFKPLRWAKEPSPPLTIPRLAHPPAFTPTSQLPSIIQTAP